MKLKLFSGKAMRNIQKSLNLKFANWSILETGFEATFKLKTNALIVWNDIFSFLAKCFSNEVESVFGDSKVKHSRLFKSIVGHRKHLRKWFWGYLEVKNDCSESL